MAPWSAWLHPQAEAGPKPGDSEAAWNKAYLSRGFLSFEGVCEEFTRYRLIGGIAALGCMVFNPLVLTWQFWSPLPPPKGHLARSGNFFKNLFYWSIVDLQFMMFFLKHLYLWCFVNFCCTAKWFSYTYIYIYIYIFLFIYFSLQFITGYWI